MWVNHEFPTPYLIHKVTLSSKKSKEQIIEEQKNVGGSILHVKKIKHQWKVIQNSKYNRRINGETKIPFSALGSVLSGALWAILANAVCPKIWKLLYYFYSLLVYLNPAD